ncbi:hypothetical protein AXH82_01885 [Microbacterium sp. PAMC 28756]|uniref:hypothetical protein n=1 Tax=Microbacterium sp. PAMC 28756 TaxID=1795053 RepID=UPI00076B3A3E|nr:hypothetical protein [Microbacterium sp. PAMC 28756]AMG82264.1 hypothetical protein AXH82_01885 [Microbacterium sp. PAMC 28756]
MRLLTEGWCERGPSLSEAAAAVPPPESAWWDSDEFVNGPDDDRRAAINLWLLTGLTPERRDVKGERGGDGFVDLLLRPAAAPVEVVEILKTLDRDHSDAVPRAAALVAELNGAEPPALLFPVHLERGWEPPLTRGGKTTSRQRRLAALPSSGCSARLMPGRSAPRLRRRRRPCSPASSSAT